MISSNLKMTMLLMLMLSGGPLLVNAKHNEDGIDLVFRQSDYQLEFKRIELVRYNKENMKDFTVVTRKYNRTQPVVNTTFTFKKDFGSDLAFVVQAYKFLSNEYRYFPLRFGAHVCQAFAANMAGIKRLLECGNFTACPVVKDKINHVCNFYPDPERFPPMIPNGDYKVELQVNNFSEELAVLDVYVVVTRPIVIKKKFP